MKKNMKKMALAGILMAGSMAIMVGCNNNENTNNDNDSNVSTEVEVNTDGGNEDEQNTSTDVNTEDMSAVTVLDNIWNELAEDSKFPCFGGSIENSVDGAPGEVALTDENMLTNTLLVPADVQGSAASVASLVHMMNSNTFTGVSVKLNGMTASDAADKIKDGFMNTQFVCGIPEKIVIAVYGDIVVYAYGDGMIVDDFMGGISALNGAEIVVDQNY